MATPFLVHHFPERAAQRSPDDPFLIHDRTAVPYGEMDANANRAARALVDEGISRGDRIGLLALNSRFYVEMYYGILKAGGIAVPLNTAADGPTLAKFVRSCGARMLIAGRRFEKVSKAAIESGTPLEILAAETAPRLPELPPGMRGLALDEACAAQSGEPPGVALTDLDLASIIYTSGSTGTPQGATLSHLNIVSNAQSIVSYLELGPEDRILQILPFYYVYGKSLLNTHALAGATVVIENRFLYPNVALDTLESEECTGLSGVPSTFAILLNRSNFAERKLTHLRYVTQAGGAMSPELTRRLMKVLSDKQIFIMYGATEASARLSYLPPKDLPRKVGSIGKAIPNVELRVLRPDGSETVVDEEGEIVARGSNIMSGYWGDPDGTAEILDEHGYHTGDLARRDEEGFMFVVGRKKDFIKAGAHRISAKEIEETILEDAEVHEAAVIGVPDEILGERIRAFVVPRDDSGFDPSALERFLKTKLPPYKVPTEIIARDELPKNESGKIMKQVLREESRPSSGE
jgi:acyl-CoA synthetase (AMP-forming)/AMP-acid ligase II